MDVRARWRRVDAEHRVHVWGRAATAVLGVVTVTGLGAGLLGAVIGAVFWVRSPPWPGG